MAFMADDLNYYLESGALDSNPYLFKKVGVLEEKVATLENEIKGLKEMIDAMWYKPAGVHMPGFNQLLAYVDDIDNVDVAEGATDADVMVEGDSEEPSTDE